VLKIYLTGRYSQKEEIKEFAEQIKSLGVEVTSSWLDEPHPPQITMDDLTKEELRDFALRDFYDLRAADAIVCFSCSPIEPTVRGGRHVEFGIALALAKNIWVLGPRENVFHFHPWVEHCKTKSRMLAKIKANMRYYANP